VYYYPGFNAARDGPKLHAELCHNLARPTAWEAVMRIRCSKGIKISHFHGHFFNRSTDLLALPTCSPDMAYAVQLQHEVSAARDGSCVYMLGLGVPSACGSAPGCHQCCCYFCWLAGEALL
jgi:protein transport protein SEC24